jgi:hypothetical protein
MVEKARWQRAHGRDAAWRVCQTCNQGFTGPMRIALADAWCAVACAHEQLEATANRGTALIELGDHAAAEPLLRRVLLAKRRALGAEHPATLTCANNLVVALIGADRHV